MKKVIFFTALYFSFFSCQTHLAPNKSYLHVDGIGDYVKAFFQNLAPINTPRSSTKIDFNASSIDLLSSFPTGDTFFGDFSCDSILVRAQEVDTDSCDHAIDLKNILGHDISFSLSPALSTGRQQATLALPSNFSVCIACPAGFSLKPSPMLICNSNFIKYGPPSGLCKDNLTINSGIRTKWFQVRCPLPDKSTVGPMKLLTPYGKQQRPLPSGWCYSLGKEDNLL